MPPSSLTKSARKTKQFVKAYSNPSLEGRDHGRRAIRLRADRLARIPEAALAAFFDGRQESGSLCSPIQEGRRYRPTLLVTPTALNLRPLARACSESKRES